MKKIVLLICLFTSLLAQAQQTRITGFISDANDGERIIGANVYLKASVEPNSIVLLENTGIVIKKKNSSN